MVLALAEQERGEGEERPRAPSTHHGGCSESCRALFLPDIIDKAVVLA